MIRSRPPRRLVGHKRHAQTETVLHPCNMPRLSQPRLAHVCRRAADRERVLDLHAVPHQSAPLGARPGLGRPAPRQSRKPRGAEAGREADLSCVRRGNARNHAGELLPAVLRLHVVRPRDDHQAGRLLRLLLTRRHAVSTTAGWTVRVPAGGVQGSDRVSLHPSRCAHPARQRVSIKLTVAPAATIIAAG